MHTIQYIAVQGDDVDEAFRRVKHELETMLGNDPESYTNTWFDWFVTGGGRWATGDENQYNDEWQGDVVHQSSPKFQEYLDKAKEFRKVSLQEYLAEANKLNIQAVLSEIDVSGGDDFHSGMQLYPIKKIYDMTMGTWDYNSYYFDIINDTASMKSLQNSLDNGANDWYLVPVDFHF
jgi:hypothetical protein